MDLIHVGNLEINLKVGTRARRYVRLDTSVKRPKREAMVPVEK